MIYDYKCNPVIPIPRLFYFSLNPNDSSIVQEARLVLKNVFQLKEDVLLDLDQLKNSIVFLDGFDELYIKLQETDCKDINDFIKKVLRYAQENHFKAVITSRKSCIDTNDRRLFHKVPVISLAELIESQHENWIKKYNALFENKYDIDNLETMYQNEKLRELIKIPILFQLIVDNNVDLNAQNLVGLYHDIFKKIVKDIEHEATRNIHANDVQEQLEQIAYSIFRDTDKYTFIEEKKLKEEKPIKLHAIISFYLYNKTENESSSKHVIEFVHRSFYQYFLAYYIYHAIETMKKKKEIRAFLKKFCYRRLDIDTLIFIAKIVDYKKKDFKDEDIQIVLEQIENMDAWCVFNSSEIESDNILLDNEVKQPYMKQAIVLSNILSVLCHLKVGLGGCLDISEREKLIMLLRLFKIKGDFSYIRCNKAYLRRVDLSKVGLIGANLRRADLSKADLNRAILMEINLIGANLRKADLIATNLGGADLRRANLNEACLRKANLSGADLRKAILIGVDLSGANLEGTKINKKDLERVCLDGVDLSKAIIYE